LISSSSIESQLLRLRKHPSMAGFLLSSDELPPINIESLYRQSVSQSGWPNPIIAAAAEGVSTYNNESTGVKMLGPYAWVPPSYWSDPNALASYGGPIGFSTEISPGGSPMSLISWLKTTHYNIKKAYCPDSGGVYSDVWDWHCGNQHGVFKSLKYFVPSLQLRYGGNFIETTTSYGTTNSGAELNFTSSSSSSSEEQCGKYDSDILENMLSKFIAYSHLTAYESHRAMFEAYASHKYNSTGVIQWMLNNGLPQHIWHLFDWFLNAGGAYYGTQRSHEPLHASYDAYDGKIRVINSLYAEIPDGEYVLNINIISLKNGESLFLKSIPLPLIPADSVLYVDTLDLKQTFQFAYDNGGVCLVRLDIVASAAGGGGDGADNEVVVTPLPKPNTYWISHQPDVVNWEQCNFYVCNITSGQNFTMLSQVLSPVRDFIKLTTSFSTCPSEPQSNMLRYPGTDLPFLTPAPSTSEETTTTTTTCFSISITNTAADLVAFFVHLELVNIDGVDFDGVDGFDDKGKVSYFDDNFFTLLPLETRTVNVKVFQDLGGELPTVLAHAFNDIILS
jgi:hypothetical protein